VSILNRGFPEQSTCGFGFLFSLPQLYSPLISNGGTLAFEVLEICISKFELGWFERFED